MNWSVYDAQVHAGLLRAGDRPVVDVGEVHHLPHLVAEQVPQRAAQHVEADERAEVADVAARVDGEAAGVHPDGVAGAGREGLFAARQGVVEAHRSWMHGRSARDGLPDRGRPCDDTTISSSPAAARNRDVAPAGRRRRRSVDRGCELVAERRRRRRPGSRRAPSTCATSSRSMSSDGAWPESSSAKKKLVGGHVAAILQ